MLNQWWGVVIEELKIILRSAKYLISFFQPLPIWIIMSMVWENDLLVIKSLEAILQHGTVGLFENVISYMDKIIGVDSKNIFIKSSMMNLAQGKTVRNDWITKLRIISYDMCCIQKLRMLQTA